MKLNKILNIFGGTITFILIFNIINSEGSTTYGTFQGVGFSCHPAYPIQKPFTLDQVQSLVLEAIGLNTTIKAFGSRHSLTDIICTSGIPLDMRKIKHVWVNITESTATCGAGAELFDVLDTLHLANRTLEHVPAYGGITIGGSVGSGSHGSSLKHPTSISDQVVSMVIVDGLGKIRTISNPKELKAFRVHLGLLGIVYEVTLRIVPQFKLQIVNYPLPESVLFTREIIKRAEKHDWFQIWWFPGSKSIVISEGNMVPTNTTGQAKTNLITEVSPLLSAVATATLEGAAETENIPLLQVFEEYTKRSLYQRVVGRDPAFSEDGLNMANPAVGFGYEMMCSKCTRCPWDVSVFVEESSISMDLDKEFPRALETIRNILKEEPTPFNMYGLFIRFSPPSDALLAMQNGRRSFHIDWISSLRFDYLTRPKVGLGTMQAIIQALVSKHFARPHWAKNGLHYLSADVIQKAHGERITEFIEYTKKSDPFGIFQNDFSRRLMNLDKKIKNYHGQKHCALQDSCICKNDEDCGPSSDMKCSYISKYRVCKRQRLISI